MADTTDGGGARSVQLDMEGMDERSIMEAVTSQNNRITRMEASLELLMAEVRQLLGDSQ